MKEDFFSKATRIVIKICAFITLFSLALILIFVIFNGLHNLSFDLFNVNFTTNNQSLFPALINNLIISLISLAISLFIGILSAIYMTEYAKQNNVAVKHIRFTTEVLSGVPSIVYGLFGMLLFVIDLGWGYSVLSGGVTLAIMVLPLIIRSTEEALFSVENSLREGCFALGVDKFNCILRVVLPGAVKGIVAGVILAIGRIFGETAALIYTAGTSASVAKSLFSSGRTLSVHMYILSSEGIFLDKAYACALVLIIIVGFINWLSFSFAKRVTRI